MPDRFRKVADKTAEYRFDNRLSAQAQWDNENSEASFGNLGLELKLSWEVE